MFGSCPMCSYCPVYFPSLIVILSFKCCRPFGRVSWCWRRIHYWPTWDRGWTNIGLLFNVRFVFVIHSIQWHTTDWTVLTRCMFIHVRSLFVVFGPCSLQIRSCDAQIFCWTGDFTLSVYVWQGHTKKLYFWNPHIFQLGEWTMGIEWPGAPKKERTYSVSVQLNQSSVTEWATNTNRTVVGQ